MELVEKFEARAIDGRKFTICKYQDFVDADDLDNPGAKIPGGAILQTLDGKRVTQNGGGTYTILGLNIKVRRLTTK